MSDLDMSKPGYELFPETTNAQYNSYADVKGDPDVGDPLNTGVKSTFDDAGQGQQSQKEMNFGALRDEISKMKEEREYWKGQAEAYNRMPSREVPQPASQPDALAALDLEDGRDVRKAFDAIRGENDRLRSEMKDAISALHTKSQYNNWDNMVTQHVPQLTSKNPIFAEMIKNTSNPYEAAYLLAELNAKASQPAPQQPQQVSGNAQRAIANAQKPQTLASVGGQGTLSSADYYAQMSDEDFMKVASRNMAGI